MPPRRPIFTKPLSGVESRQNPPPGDNMHFQADANWLQSVLEAHPFVAANGDVDLFLRHLTEVLWTNPHALCSPAQLSTELRECLIATCCDRIAEHEELIEMIKLGFEAGYNHIPPEIGAAEPRRVAAGLEGLLRNLTAVEQ